MNTGRTIEEALEFAKTPGPQGCGMCESNMFSPMDKLAIALYGECAIHLADDSIEERNLLKIAEAL